MPLNPYLDILYPLQDQALTALASSPHFPFYLTGGTALNRFYCHHRYSDDLDFFSLGELPDFRSSVQNALALLKIPGADITLETASSHFCRAFIRASQTALKIDFINDPVYRYGELASFPLFPRVDNTTNILANKLTALDRHEAKDIVDLWTLAKTTSFSWRSIMEIALQKSPLDPPDSANIITQMPASELETIQWATPIDSHKIFNEIQILARDILLGQSNSLCP